MEFLVAAINEIHKFGTCEPAVNQQVIERYLVAYRILHHIQQLDTLAHEILFLAFGNMTLLVTFALITPIPLFRGKPLFLAINLTLLAMKRMDAIADNPLKFIIFIDDLSFSSDDADFGALKAVLEGSIASKASNAVIYATSNRRHLVKESFADRDGDDIHARDTREELASLSERFGLKVTFLKPDKDTYLKIVEYLAGQYGIEMDKDELFTKAEAYALRRSGRSGRAARHFVEMLKAEEPSDNE